MVPGTNTIRDLGQKDEWDKEKTVPLQQPEVLHSGWDKGKCFPEEQGELSSPNLDEEAQKLQAQLTAFLL